jgi:phosphatidylserine/phosphatidylglycerophosphate/cardiolipin synthase-like enzyme
VLLTNEKGETLRRLQALIPECVHVDIVVGYMSAQGFALLEESFAQCLASGGTVHITVGELCEGGDYERCRRLVDAWPGKLNVHVSGMPNRLVHGKVYLLQQHLQSLMIIGSSNLTCGGLQANAEINVEIPVAADGLERVRSYIAFLKTYAVPLEESTLESDVGGIKMGSSEASVRLDRQSIKTLRQFAERLMGQISKDEIDKWCHEIDEMSAMFNDALSLDSLRSGKWTGESVKTELLMKHVWAVREAQHTALLPRIRETPGDRIVSKLLDMVAAADQELPSDEVIQIARIPDVIGISIASEVLHKMQTRQIRDQEQT